MVPMHLPPMAPMNRVEQIRALRWPDRWRAYRSPLPACARRTLRPDLSDSGEKAAVASSNEPKFSFHDPCGATRVSTATRANAADLTVQELLTDPPGLPRVCVTSVVAKSAVTDSVVSSSVRGRRQDRLHDDPADAEDDHGEVEGRAVAADLPTHPAHQPTDPAPGASLSWEPAPRCHCISLRVAHHEGAALGHRGERLRVRRGLRDHACARPSPQPRTLHILRLSVRPPYHNKDGV